MWMGHSSLTSRQVPIWAPQAPRAKGAASWRAVARAPGGAAGRGGAYQLPRSGRGGRRPAQHGGECRESRQQGDGQKLGRRVRMAWIVGSARVGMRVGDAVTAYRMGMAEEGGTALIPHRQRQQQRRYVFYPLFTHGAQRYDIYLVPANEGLLSGLAAAGGCRQKVFPRLK